MAALVDTNSTQPSRLPAMQAEARERNVELLLLKIGKADEIATVIEAAKASDATALNVLASTVLYANRLEIVQCAASAFSEIGTFTCRASLTMSAHRGKADIPPQGRDFRF